MSTYFKSPCSKLKAKSLLLTVSTLLLLAFISPAQAQVADTTLIKWITSEKTYYKIPVLNKGIYRVTVSDLITAGISVNTINPQALQLYHRGIEQAIFVSGEGDGRIDNSDYIEFYGKGNDGSQDSLLYQPSSAQPSKYYSLYTDTAAYFLTWRTDNLLGKRMDGYKQANILSLPAEAYHLEEQVQVYTSDFSTGQIYPLGTTQETHLSHWDAGEGWTGTIFNKASNLDLPFTLTRKVNPNGVKSKIEVVLVGRNNKKHNVEVFVGASAASLRSVGSFEYVYFSKQLITIDLETGDISGTGGAIVRIRSNGYADEPNDRSSVCYTRVLYPQSFDMVGTIAGTSVPQKSFNLMANGINRSFLEIPSPPAGIKLYDITDLNSLITVGGDLADGKYKALVRNTAVPRTIFANTTFMNVLPLRRVAFRKINPASYNYLIVSHKALMKPAGGFPDAVRAYGAYRASPAGGGYDTLVVDTDLLYNQFNYGEFSPLAIRRFADFMLSGGKPQFLFLIGRSWYPHFGRKNPFRYEIDLVPTAGYPGSDIMLTAGLHGNLPSVPAIATGRLNIPSGVLPNFPTDNNFNHADPNEVIAYLNKVKEHEAAPTNTLWRKNLLHLSGGHTPNELTIFRQFVDDFTTIAENGYLGGKAATISKKTDNVVEFINVVEEVNKGIGVLTFFGHSAPNVIDIDIGYVSNNLLGYHNKGKYPFVLVNGCDAGDIFYGSSTFGSDWIKTADRGAVLFVAHSSVGYSVPLKNYADQLYTTAFDDSSYIYKPFGLVQKESIRRYLTISSSEYDVANAQQLTLQGDPAVAIFPANKPDYAVDNTGIFLQPFNNAPITAVSDSFQVGIIVANYGIAGKQSFGITINRTLGNGTSVKYDTVLYAPVTYQDTLYFTVKKPIGTPSGGNNRFEIKLDPGEVIPELNESNNTATLEYFVPTQGVLALFPREYSIVNTETSNIPSVSLIAQTAEGIASTASQARSFLFEIDTTTTFNSPGKRTQTVSSDFLATWNTTLLGTGVSHDSTVYYWRVRFGDKPAGPDNVWAERSFTYITNSPDGWSQSRQAQFTKSSNIQMHQNSQLTQWEYEAILTKIGVQTAGNSDPNAFKQTKLMLNGLPVLSAGKCSSNALVGVTFHQSTTLPYSINDNLLCFNSVPYVANFMYDGNILNSNDQLTNYINLVPTGDYVLLFTLGTVSFSNWTPALRQMLVSIGASSAQIANLKSGQPYIILGKKGAADGKAILEVLPDYSVNADLPTEQQLLLNHDLNGRYTNSTITSSVVGPASEWGSVFRKVVKANASTNWALEVIGISSQGAETVLESNVATDNFSLAGVDAKQYPYLKLRLRTEDLSGLTPPQLSRWQVIYKGVPEGLVNPAFVSKTEYTIADHQEGENFQINFAYQNISPRSFEDSLTFRYTLLNKTTRQQTVKEWKVKKLAPGDSVKVTLPIQTVGKAGDNLLTAFFNPRVLPEEYYENNVQEVSFRIKKDRVNPVLDVAFDGTHIMNGDIVSPSPLISVSLKDENKYLIRKDTVGLDLFLKKPGTSSTFEKISFSSPEVKYFPAQSGKNDFRLEYHPRSMSDGMYSLRVQGSDLSGNVSGVEPYQVDFEVVNESKITHFYPYPNPFSTKTRFVFTLTGADIPDQIKIQVMTVAGRVVREITQNELGPIRIGNNISEYAWDGTDEFGDKLANGVYLYRVIVRSNGQEIERRTTAADKAFNKEFGKMYILR
ncbi:MAG: C25 family cysteine peptidase [Bacteroidota bacterium]